MYPLCYVLLFAGEWGFEDRPLSAWVEQGAIKHPCWQTLAKLVTVLGAGLLTDPPPA